MGIQITELTFLESMAEKFAIPTPEYVTADANQAAIKSALARWGNRALAKPDILAGKRGKAGKIEEVRDPRGALLKLRALAAVELGGKIARTSYLVQYIPAEMEVYSAILYDSRTLGPVMTVSLHGGVDIESVPAEQKRTIAIDVFKGLNAYQAQQALQELHCPPDLISPLARALVSLWDLFIASGMTLAEVNPWRVTPEGRIYACDFKGALDEANYHFSDVAEAVPEYPASRTEFEEAMANVRVARTQMALKQMLKQILRREVLVDFEAVDDIAALSAGPSASDAVVYEAASVTRPAAKVAEAPITTAGGVKRLADWYDHPDVRQVLEAFNGDIADVM